MIVYLYIYTIIQVYNYYDLLSTRAWRSRQELLRVGFVKQSHPIAFRPLLLLSMYRSSSYTEGIKSLNAVLICESNVMPGAIRFDFWSVWRMVFLPASYKNVRYRWWSQAPLTFHISKNKTVYKYNVYLLIQYTKFSVYLNILQDVII